MNLWTTAVECLLQSNHNNVIMSIDLSNMFNDVSREQLCAELLRHEDAEVSSREA